MAFANIVAIASCAAVRAVCSFESRSARSHSGARFTTSRMVSCRSTFSSMILSSTTAGDTQAPHSVRLSNKQDVGLILPSYVDAASERQFADCSSSALLPLQACLDHCRAEERQPEHTRQVGRLHPLASCKRLDLDFALAQFGPLAMGLGDEAQQRRINRWDERRARGIDQPYNMAGPCHASVAGERDGGLLGLSSNAKHPGDLSC